MACAETDIAQLERHSFRRGGHPAREDGCLGVQGVHLRHAVPEARLGPVRGRARAGHRRGARPRAAAAPRPSSAPNSPDFYTETFFVQQRARWEYLRDDLHHNVGDGLNKALAALEDHNPALDGVVQHIDFTRKVGQSSMSDKKLRDLIVHFSKYRLRNEDFEFPDLLGAAYEYLIGEFADSAGKKGGEFYTPRSVVRMMVGLVEPQRGDERLRPVLRVGRHADPVQGVRRGARRQRAQPAPGRPGEQRQRLVDLEDEPAAPRHPRRGHAQRRHARRARCTSRAAS